MKKHVKVAAGLVFEKGRIFATKRGESPYSYLAHKYEFPGGKLEPGESGPDTVKRELKEELSLDVKVGGPRRSRGPDASAQSYSISSTALVVSPEEPSTWNSSPSMNFCIRSAKAGTFSGTVVEVSRSITTRSCISMS